MEKYFTKDPVKFSISEILDEAEILISDARTSFGNLNHKQINWKPDSETWSVGQCISHLIQVNSQYFPQLSEIIKGAKRTTLWQRMPLLPEFFGKLVINAVSPKAPRKVKTPKSFNPVSGDLDSSIITTFIYHQREVIEKMKATKSMNLDQIIIYSPATKVITYSLLDAYRIIVAHERRHLNQAIRLMASAGFPG